MHLEHIGAFAHDDDGRLGLVFGPSWAATGSAQDLALSTYEPVVVAGASLVATTEVIVYMLVVVTCWGFVVCVIVYGVFIVW